MPNGQLQGKDGLTDLTCLENCQRSPLPALANLFMHGIYAELKLGGRSAEKRTRRLKSLRREIDGVDS